MFERRFKDIHEEEQVKMINIHGIDDIVGISTFIDGGVAVGVMRQEIFLIFCLFCVDKVLL